jgi:hypothetical protein
MPIDFPSGPTTGQVYSYLGKSWVYSGSAWDGVTPNYTLPAPSGNAIINGAFDIWQRGTSFSGAGLLYSADRWTYWRDAYASGITASRQNTGDIVNLPNSKYCLRIARNSGNTGTGLLYTNQPFTNDDSTIFIGQTVTLSAWARVGATFSGSGLNMIVRSGTGTNQPVNNMTGAFTVAGATRGVTQTWQRITVTGTVPTNATQIGVEFSYTPTGTAGATDYFEVTNVQLEAGAVATPFKRNAPSIQAELAACQRYYQKFSGSTFTSPAIGYTPTTTLVETFHWLAVPMRVTPTSVGLGGTWNFVGMSANITTGALSSPGISTARSSANLVSLNIATPATTAFVSGHLRASNDANAFIEYSSEL